METEPKSGKLCVGTTGIDRNVIGVERLFKVISINTITRVGYYPSSLSSSDRAQVQYEDGSMAVVSLQFKQNTHNDAMRHRIRSVKIKIPRYLAEEKLDMDDQMAWFLGWIAGSYGDLHIMSDAPSVKAQPMENKYRQLTGKVLSWRLPPPDSTAEEQRYGARAIISFVSINNLPKQLVRYAKVETARTNINHVAFLWALIRFGFDFGQMQNIQKIRLNVPESYRGVFDKGVIGESI